VSRKDTILILLDQLEKTVEWAQHNTPETPLVRLNAQVPGGYEVSNPWYEQIQESKELIARYRKDYPRGSTSV